VTKKALTFLGVDKNTRPVSFWLGDDEQDKLDEEQNSESYEEDVPLWLMDENWKIVINPNEINPLVYQDEEEEKEKKKKKYQQSIDISLLDNQESIWKDKGKGRGIGKDQGIESNQTGNSRLLLNRISSRNLKNNINPDGVEEEFIEEGRPQRMPRNIGKKKPKRVTHIPYFIIGSSITMLVLMLYEIWVNGGIEPLSTNPFIGVSAEALVYIGGKWSPYILDRGEWWRLFVPIFLHSGFIHIGLNLLIQVLIGMKLEIQHGTFRILPIYLLSGVFGNLLSCIFLPKTVSVGASGAIFGFFGILLVDLIKNWKKLKSPVKDLIIFIISMSFSIAFGLLPLIDNFQHIGGFLMGIISGVVFLPSIHFGKRNVTLRVIQVVVSAPIMIGVTVALLIVLYSRQPPDWCPICYNLNCVQLFDWTCTREY